MTKLHDYYVGVISEHYLNIQPKAGDLASMQVQIFKMAAEGGKTAVSKARTNDVLHSKAVEFLHLCVRC